MTLWGKHRNSTKPGKQYANRKIRRKLRDYTIEISNGRYYKHLGVDSWDLWEFKFHETRKKVISKWESEQLERANNVLKWKRTFTLEEIINDWEKYYIRK